MGGERTHFQEDHMLGHMDTMTQIFGGDVVVDGGSVTVNRPAALESAQMDALVRSAVFGDQASKDYARWLIW